MGKVSIIIPAYNAEAFLKRCVDSVLSQKYENIEIILVNDGSRDRTLEICDEYERQDSRIRVISQENKGVAAARNVGLSKASGDYILYVDSDDWIEANMVETLVSAINSKPQLDIAFCGFDNAETRSQIITVPQKEPQFWNQQQQQVEFLRHKQITGMLWNKLIRRNLFDGLSFDENVGYGEDAQMLWKVLRASRNMIVINDVLYHHVLEKQSISHLTFSHNKYTAIFVWEEIADDVKKNYPQWIDLVKERLFATATYTYYEMKCGHYVNKEEMLYLRKIVRSNAAMFFKAKDLTIKMKAFAVLIFCGL